jgi:hypothetical protein
MGFIFKFYVPSGRKKINPISRNRGPFSTKETLTQYKKNRRSTAPNIQDPETTPFHSL